MKKTDKKRLIKMFLDKKNMTYNQCSENQKKVFNDDYDRWERYDWEWLSDKTKNIKNENTKM